MKRLIYIYLFQLLLSNGCINTLNQGSKSTNCFPKIMVGIWQTEKNPVTRSQWAFKFEPDGTIKKMIHGQAGPVVLKEGGVEGRGYFENSEYVFIFGEVYTEYLHSENLLKVVIPVEYFKIELPQGNIQGNLKDVFVGKVSIDGIKWVTSRFTYSNIDGVSPISEEIVEKNPDQVVFYKVNINDLQDTKDTQ